MGYYRPARLCLIVRVPCLPCHSHVRLQDLVHILESSILFLRILAVCQPQRFQNNLHIRIHLQACQAPQFSCQLRWTPFSIALSGQPALFAQLPLCTDCCQQSTDHAII